MTNVRKKIGVDLDGVLANFIQKYHDWAETVTGRLIAEPQSDWNATNWKLTDLDSTRIWDHIKNTTNFWMTLSKCVGATAASLLKLDDNNTVYYITSRVDTLGDSVEKQSAHWLFRNFGIVYPTVIVSSDKGPLAAALGLDAMIDDKPENLFDVWTYSAQTKLYLMDATYNQTAHGVIRVNSFEEFANIYG